MRVGDNAGGLRQASTSAQTGFTYVWLLAAIAILSTGLAAIGPSWSDQARREREQDLLRVGALYAKAIAVYRGASPGSQKLYPATLDDLLLDTRMVGTVRHMRKLYPDPLGPERAWGLVLGPDGRVRGVFSQSTDAPLRTEALELASASLPAARKYSDWKFVAKERP